MPAPIKLLRNARELIETLAEEGALTHGELAERMGMPRASVYRLVDGLQSIGLVDTGPDSTVRLSPEWLHLADAAEASLTEWAGTHHVLDGLVERTGQTAFVCVPREHRAFCIDWVPGRALEVLALRPGRSLAPNIGAAGRIVLAYDPEAEEVIASGPLERLTRKSLATPRELREDVRLTRERGYVLSDEDATDGIGAIGVPILDQRGQLYGALSLAGVADEIVARQEELLEALGPAAAELASLRSSGE